MKYTLALIALTVVCVGCPGWVGAVGGPIGCTFTGTANSQATTWEVVFPEFVQYSGAIGSTMAGFNWTTNAGLYGSAYLIGGFPAHMTWTEGPSTSFQFVRHVNVNLGANLQGTGTLFDQGLTGFFQASVAITSGSCTSAVDP